ncbi:MAG TPA: MFS transporter [Caulobacteraceae bacterium]|nr:MFS transporter [Caulobacteraceae bacterium]
MATEAIQQPAAAQRRHLFAAVLGNGLEFYDFVVYGFFAIQIGHAFFPAHDKFTNLMLSLMTFGAGFLTRPVGAFVIGAYADRIGRRAAMMLCFVLMGIAIGGMALIPTYASIGLAAPVLAVIARMLQGFSVGGEVGSNTAYLVEAAPPERRGEITAWQGGSQAISSILGSLVGLLLASVLDAHALDAYGWRIAFLLGAVTVPFGILLRRSMPETLHHEEAHAHVPRVKGSFPIPRVILLALVVLGGGTISTYVINYMTTFAQDTLHLGPRLAFAATFVPNLVQLPTCLLGGWLSDRYGRKAIMIWPQLIRAVVTLPIFWLIVSRPSAATLLGGMAVIGSLAGLTSGAFYPAFAESLAKNRRSMAFAATYSIAIMTFGGTTQPVILWLIHATGQPIAPAVYMAAAVFLALLAMIAMEESAPIKRVRTQAAEPALA